MVGLPYVTVVLKVLVEFKQKDGAELHTKAVLEENCQMETFFEASFMMGIRSKPTRVSAFWWTVFGPQKDSTSNTLNLSTNVVVKFIFTTLPLPILLI